jgi:hypothetical protein
MNFDKYKSKTEEMRLQDPPVIPVGHPEHGLTVADYDDHYPARPPAWMTTPSIVLLEEYLEKYQDQGIMLFERTGRFGIRFDPPMTAESFQGDRGQKVENLYILLYDAVDDLRHMIINGIELPPMIQSAIAVTGNNDPNDDHPAQHSQAAVSRARVLPGGR